MFRSAKALSELSFEVSFEIFCLSAINFSHFTFSFFCLSKKSSLCKPSFVLNLFMKAARSDFLSALKTSMSPPQGPFATILSRSFTDKSKLSS